MAFSLSSVLNGHSPYQYHHDLLSSPLVVVAADDHQVLHSSPSALQLVGRGPDEACDLYTFEACFEPAAAAPAASGMLGRCGPGAEAREVQLTTKAGDPLWCIAVHVPLTWCGDRDGLSLVFLVRAGKTPPSRRTAWAAASMPSMLRQVADDFGAAAQTCYLLEAGRSGWLAGGVPSLVLASASPSATAPLTRPLSTWVARVAKAKASQVTRSCHEANNRTKTTKRAPVSNANAPVSNAAAHSLLVLIAAWPLQDIDLLRGFCARINHPCIAPSHLHCPH